MSELLILLTLSFIIFSSPYIAALIRLPTSATEILLGVIFGSIGFLASNDMFKIVADVGFYYLMFLAGIKVDLKVFLTMPKRTLRNTILFLILLYVLSFIVVYAYGLNEIYLIVLPVLSVGVLSTFYKEYGNDAKWLNTGMFVGIVGEVVSIALLTVLSSYINNGFGAKLFINLGALLGFLAVTALLLRWTDVLFWWFPNLKKALMPQFDKSEKDIRLSISLLCAVIAMMIILDLKVIIGAFIAGTLIPTFFAHKKDLPAKLESFGFGFLVPIFFVYIGSTVNLNVLLTPSITKSIIFLSIIMFFVRSLASFVFYKELGGLRQTLLFSASISAPLTLLIAIATVGYETNFIQDDAYYSMVLASVLQAILSTSVIKILVTLKK
ncbi:MAG: cation:proton antiporter [Campylobacter sp.]|nr:cation:proton antiporter [Campylobacter sp.]